VLKRSDFYVHDPDPDLPHQLRLRWVALEVLAVCNCGARIGDYKPSPAVDKAIKADYDRHVGEVLKEQAAQEALAGH
jgi:hypothetical protein